jgi:uncharacterized membrane protein
VHTRASNPMRLQLLVAAMMSVLTVGLAFLDVPVLGPLVGLVGVFIVPGWLLTSVLFGDHGGPDQETRFILVFGLGAVLMALELFTLSLANVQISRASISLAGALTSWGLIGARALQHRTEQYGRRGFRGLNTLLLSICAVLLLYGFVPLHQPVTQESYTEFYTLPRVSRAADGQVFNVDLVIANHEQQGYTYTVLCSDTTGPESVLAKSYLEPESKLSIGLFVPPPHPDSTDKVSLYLYREGDESPYRRVQLAWRECDRIGVMRHEDRLRSYDPRP